MSSVADGAPANMKPTIWLAVMAVAVIAAGGAAYAAVTKRIEEVSGAKDAVLVQRQNDHEKQNDEQFTRIEKTLDRIETKLDKLRERK